MLNLLKARILGHADLLFRYRHIWPWLVLFLSLALVFGFGLLLNRYVERQDRQILQMQSVELAAGIEQRIKESEAILRAAGAAFAFVPQIDGNFFSAYFKGLQLDLSYRGIVGIGWTIPVARENLTQLEDRMRAAGKEDFFVWPVTDERMNYAILYLEPDNARNRAAIGFNMYSDPVRREAMLKAFTTAKPQASGAVLLRHDVNGQNLPGFMIYAPVYDGRGRLRGEAPSNHAFRGFVYAAFRVGDLATSVLGPNRSRHLDLEIYDVTNGSPQLLYDLRPEIWSAKNDQSIVTAMSVSGRQWQLVVAPVQTVEFADFPQKLMIYFLFGTGILVSFLLAATVWLTLRYIASSQQALDRQVEQLRIRAILLRELNHRVKNTIATVISLAALAREGVTDVDSYYEALNGRLRALSATHDLLTSSDWSDTELRDIAEAELAPFRGVKGQVLIEGPSVRFDPTKALSLGLSIHELATNASKYGALSTADGHVSLLWYVDDKGFLKMLWTETGGPAVLDDSRRGFGRTLIEKLMARQLRAEVHMSFPAEGAVCEFSIPLDPPVSHPTRGKNRRLTHSVLTKP